MPSAYRLWSNGFDLANGASRRLFGRDLESVMQKGCSVIRSCPTTSGVALTFDDGPHPEFTPLILDALSRAGIRACFFCVGLNAKSCPAMVRAIRAAGHDIGNHTMTHPDLYWVSPMRLRAEVLDCQALLEDIIGEKVLYFRAPYGHFRRDLARASPGPEWLVGWDVGPPWDLTEAAQYSADISSTTRPGSIVLLHDCLLGVEKFKAARIIGAVAASIPLFAPAIRASHEFSSLGEMLQRERGMSRT